MPRKRGLPQQRFDRPHVGTGLLADRPADEIHGKFKIICQRFHGIILQVRRYVSLVQFNVLSLFHESMLETVTHEIRIATEVQLPHQPHFVRAHGLVAEPEIKRNAIDALPG